MLWVWRSIGSKLVPVIAWLALFCRALGPDTRRVSSYFAFPTFDVFWSIYFFKVCRKNVDSKDSNNTEYYCYCTTLRHPWKIVRTVAVWTNSYIKIAYPRNIPFFPVDLDNVSTGVPLRGACAVVLDDANPGTGKRENGRGESETRALMLHNL